MSTGTVSPTVALVVKLVAKPDETDEVRTFLADALRLANQEQGTIAWFALRTDTTTFWIVDAFPSDGERQAHLEGAIASSLLANAERLLDVSGGARYRSCGARTLATTARCCMSLAQ